MSHGERRRSRVGEEPPVAQGPALKPRAQPGRPGRVPSAEGTPRPRSDHRTARTWEPAAPEARVTDMSGSSDMLPLRVSQG